MNIQLTPEIKNLIAQWENDPCWDLEETEGFEAHREELLAHRLQKEAEWSAGYGMKVVAKAEAIGCPGNAELAVYVMSLESRIAKLEEKANV